MVMVMLVSIGIYPGTRHHKSQSNILVEQNAINHTNYSQEINMWLTSSAFHKKWEIPAGVRMRDTRHDILVFDI